MYGSYYFIRWGKRGQRTDCSGGGPPAYANEIYDRTAVVRRGCHRFVEERNNIAGRHFGSGLSGGIGGHSRSVPE